VTFRSELDRELDAHVVDSAGSPPAHRISASGRQKMSLQEIKEEFRQTEGDPVVKGKLRQLRQARMRKRIMAAVPKASVVITNPTHFAVALRYERGMNAPVCVAKGVDLIARKIRKVAGLHDIPVVENPPLARALHGTVEIDQEIPRSITAR
jgi:flagellar biosynthesis protein FlhB